MAADEQVRVIIGAQSTGEEAYNIHERGLSRVSGAARVGVVAFRDARAESLVMQRSFMALGSTMMLVNSGFMLFGKQNESVRKIMLGVNMAIAAANTLLTINALRHAIAAKSAYAEGVAKIFASGLAAPLVLAIVAGAVLGAVALAASSQGKMKMAFGGEGILTRPTMIIAGESGPEKYSFTPLRGPPAASSPSGNNMTIRQLNITIKSDDPDRIGDALTRHLRKLTEAGA